MIKVFFLVAALFFINACSTNNYIHPSKETQGVSTIESFNEGVKFGMTPGEYTIIAPILVNEKHITRFWSAHDTLRILPGKTTFLTEVNYRPSLMSSTYSNSMVLSATIKPNSQYFFKGGLIDSKLQSWIEDANGNKVSDVAEASLVVKPQDTTIYVPMY